MDCDNTDLLLPGIRDRVSNSVLVFALVLRVCGIGQSFRLVLLRATFEACLSRFRRIVDDFFHWPADPGNGVSGYKWADESRWIAFYRSPDAVWFSIHSYCRDTGYGSRPFRRQEDMGSTKGPGLWFHYDNGVVSLGDIILLMLSVANTQDLSIGFSFPGPPVSIASRSRLHGYDEETYRETIGYPGCQWNYDQSCSFLYPGRRVYGLSGYQLGAVNEDSKKKEKPEIE